MADPDKARVSFAVRKKTKMKLEDIQKEIRKLTGENISFPDLTDKIVMRTDLKDIMGGFDYDITVKMDRRKRK